MVNIRLNEEKKPNLLVGVKNIGSDISEENKHVGSDINEVKIFRINFKNSS
jgi:hypothetical protein